MPLPLPPAPDRPFAQPFGQANLELAKWVAVLTMAIDHYGKIVDPGIFDETHAIGRLAFPLFAAIVGARLAMRPELDRRYLLYLIPFALISQPAYVLAGRDWYQGNIMFTLALGVAAAMVLRRRAEVPDWATVGVLAAIAVASAFTEYGPLGVLMIPAMAYLIARVKLAGLAAAGPLGLLANAGPAWPPLQLLDLAALLAAPVLLVSVRARLQVSRLPGLVFYAFYPTHLMALHFYDVYRWA